MLFSFPFILIYLWKRKQIVHGVVPVSLQCLLKSCQMYFYFQSLSFKEFLKEKQQIVCSMEQMVSWINLKKHKHNPTTPHTWWFIIGEKKKNTFSLKCSGRSCNIKHTAPVPVVPLCKINTQLEKHKQTKLKSPSHRFTYKEETECCLWSRHELLECLYPTVPACYFWAELSGRKKAEGILPAALGSQLHVHSGNSLGLSQSWCWSWLQWFMARALGWLCCVFQLWCGTGALQTGMCCWHLDFCTLGLS